MAKTPLLTAAQFRRIEPDLPANRRDRVMISAILFRASSGRSLREVCEIFGTTRTRMNEWENVLTNVVPRIMRKLRLEPANQRMWSSGGMDWRKRHSGLHERSMNFRLRNFRDALKAE